MKRNGDPAMADRLAHITNWRASGKTQKAYCAEHDITLTTFYSWRKQQRSKNDQVAGGFVPLGSEPSPRLEITVGEVQVKIYG